MILPAITSLLTDSEAEYLCELITPKEIKLYFQKKPAAFAELQSGFRAKALTDQRAIDLIVRNRQKNFVATFLTSFIETYLKDIHDQMESLQESGATPDEAMIQALAGSHVFSSHIELYFKIDDHPVSEEHISLINAAVSLLYTKNAEIKGKQSSNTELSNSLELVQRELAEVREAYEHTQESLIADKLAVQKELDSKQDELSEAAIKIVKMQAELARFHRLEEYADIPQENSAYEEYQYTSLCQVILNSRTGQMWLKRLADLHNDQLVPFQADKTIPYGFGNRDMIYKQNGPATVGFFGIWHWNATPDRDNPEKDRIDSEFDAKLVPVQILVLHNCTKQEDIIEQLAKGISFERIGLKVLISMPPIDEQYSGFLCNINDFDIRSGIAKLKTSVFTLPLFHIHAWNTLTLNSRIFCRSMSLGLPLDLIRVKDPLTLVRDILTNTEVKTLKQQGLGVNEARRCLDYFRSLETATLYDKVAKNYGCSIEDAKKYVSEFIEQAEKSLDGSDINTNVLAAVIERNSTLMSKCKDMLYEEWSAENEEELRTAQQALEDVINKTEQQRQDATALKMQYDNLQQQIKTVQAEIAEKEALASAVEEKVANRIAEARQKAADFISDLAFTAPVGSQSFGRTGTALSVFVRPVNVDKISGTITDISDFEDSLAENLECYGYSEERSAMLSQILSFCVGRHIPIICDSSPEMIADCLAAMFGLNGVTSIHLSTGEPFSVELCDLLCQKKDTSCYQVYLINGALDAYSPNAFNGILQNTCNMGGVILIFSSEGTPTDAVSPAIWGRAMFVDGDIGLIHLPQDRLRAFETKFDFYQELKLDKLKEKRKQLKPFAEIISNRALLNYACFMASTNSAIQSDMCILTQILLSAKASGNLENLLERFKENGIDIEEKAFSKYL